MAGFYEIVGTERGCKAELELEPSLFPCFSVIIVGAEDLSGNGSGGFCDSSGES